MGLFDRVERKLDRVINGAFARAFKAEVQPVELAAAIRRSMDDQAATVGRGRAIVPNRFVVELAPTDYHRLSQYADVLAGELIASAEEHAESQRYRPGGPLQVDFTREDDLDTGMFRIRPGVGRERAVSPRARPQPAASRAAREAGAADARRRLPHHPPHPPEATSPADGAIGMASHAASAAIGAAAGTAAAARSSQRDDLAAWPGDDDGPPTRADRAPTTDTGLHRDPADRPWIEIGEDTYPLLAAITVVGRDPKADITLDDPGISRTHCEIRITHDGPHLVIGLRDLGSTNGTYVNGERVDGRRLDDGDRVTIGRLSFTLRARRR